MTISARTQSGSTVCYRSPMQIRFYRLDFTPMEGEPAEK